MKNFVTMAFVIVFLTIAISFKIKTESSYVYIENGEFIRNKKTYKYVGTNLWYGAILGSTGEGGDRERLRKELDFMSGIGVNNLRILIGSDGERGITSKVEPTLQVAPGVYNDTILDGLDYLLSEMGKRKMTAVLFFNNSWEWSGGYGQYLEWAGYGKSPVPAVDGWDNYMKFVNNFHKSDSAKLLFTNYVKDIVSRKNRYTNKKYSEDPTIMSWQIGNEPRAFSDENKEAFATWIIETADLIRSLDKNHLISTGSEGKHGCEQDIDLYEKIHGDKNIDYLNIHIWPYNWGWAKKDSLDHYLENAKESAKRYIDEHMVIAEKYNKPIVLEEFGYPRDGFLFTRDSETKSRDKFFEYVFSLIGDKDKGYDKFCGCNFWAWGGYAEPGNTFWQKGDHYTGDPAQEEQGLNSVFVTDPTIKIIKNANFKLNNSVNDEI